jgi:hypothetical protein
LLQYKYKFFYIYKKKKKKTQNKHFKPSLKFGVSNVQTQFIIKKKISNLQIFKRKKNFPFFFGFSNCGIFSKNKKLKKNFYLKKKRRTHKYMK